MFRPSRIRLSILAAALLASISTLAQSAPQKLPGHVPKIVSRLTPVGRLSATNQLELAIGLPVRNQAELDAFLQEVSDPQSPNYRHYLTPQQFTERFGPSEQDYQAVEAFFRTNGFAVTGEHPNRVVLDVAASAKDVERVFHVTLRTYRHPSEDRTFFAPDVEPSIDLSTRVLSVSGLSDYSKPRPKVVVPKEGTASIKGGVGSGPTGNYLGNDFRAAYAPGVTQTGAGQTVALVQFDGYYPVDITNYVTLCGFSMVPLTNILIDSFSGTPSGDVTANLEVSLDIELVIAMAPGVSKIMVYEGNPSNFHPNNVLNRIATDNLASQVSSSWGWSGGPDPTTEQIFKQMISQGQTYFNASGDGDAFTNNYVDNPSVTGQPSGSTNIIQVGGTTLLATNPVSEKVWNSSTNGVGSAGGISFSNVIPYWQTNISMTANHGSTTRHNIPDVSLTAEQIFIKYGNGLNATNVGGTSCAAPLWAGFTALINQRAAQAGQPPVGYINPAVYAIGKSGSYSADFNDVTVGSNAWKQSPTNYPAVAGYDLATGWGTPKGINLINALATPDPLGISPGAGFSASGAMGGPFNVNVQNFGLTNSGGSTLSWSLFNLPSWLTASTNGGSIAGGAGTTVALALNSVASNLFAGTYSTNVTFTNLTSHIAQTRSFSLALGQSLIQNGGFESGSFSSWTFGGTGPNVNLVDNGTISGMAPHTGTFFAALGEFNGATATLSQNLSTVPGQTYLLSLWLRNPSAGATEKFIINWNTNPPATNNIFNQLNPPAFNFWSNLVFTVTATGTNTLLQFISENDPAYYGLDDVSVQPIPSPTVRAVARTNNTFALTFFSLAGIQYQFQYSTNLAQTNWFTLSTNTAIDFTTTLTNSIGTNQQRYYRIRRLP